MLIALSPMPIETASTALTQPMPVTTVASVISTLPPSLALYARKRDIIGNHEFDTDRNRYLAACPDFG